MVLNKTKKAFTLVESLVVMFILSVIAACTLVTLKPGTIKKDALIKSAPVVENKIMFATNQILFKSTASGSLTSMFDSSGTFSITSSDIGDRFAAFYKKYLGSLRNQNLKSGYPGNISDTAFTNAFVAKGGIYVAFKFNGNCSTTESIVYDPMQPNTHQKTNSCALIFYDVNADSEPNTLGVDQYVLSIGKHGIK